MMLVPRKEQVFKWSMIGSCGRNFDLEIGMSIFWSA